jgi:hypothetical protein
MFSTQPIREGLGLQNTMKNIKGRNVTEATGRDCEEEGAV